MPDNKRLRKLIHDSKAVDFDAVGRLVSEMGKDIAHAEEAGGDYIAKGIESIVHVYKMDMKDLKDIRALPALDSLTEIKNVVKPG